MQLPKSIKIAPTKCKCEKGYESVKSSQARSYILYFESLFIQSAKHVKYK